MLAEAALLEQQLRQNPQLETLRQQTLDAYRRAGRVDPWNPLTQLLMVGFVNANPGLAPALTEEESPERLLLTAVAIDPLYVPALDALMDKLTSEGRHAEAYGLLRQRVYPWMRFLARQDKAAADRYLQFLLALARARGEDAFAREVEAILPEVQGTRELVKERWWF